MACLGGLGQMITLRFGFMISFSWYLCWKPKSILFLFFSLFLKNNFSPATWESGNAFLSGAWGLRFKSRASQIKHIVAIGSPPLRHILKRSCVACRHNDAETGPANSLHASAWCSEYNKRSNYWRNYLIFLFFFHCHGPFVFVLTTFFHKYCLLSLQRQVFPLFQDGCSARELVKDFYSLVLLALSSLLKLEEIELGAVHKRRPHLGGERG